MAQKSSAKQETVSATASQARLLEDAIETPIDDVLAEVMEQLHITQPPSYERREITIADIRIPHEKRMRGVNRYTRNFKIAGVLHDPAVEAVAGSDQFEAIYGRHRICGMRDAGAATMWVRVYSHLSPQLRAFFRLSEQRRRTNNWVDELEQVIDVVDEGCGLSEKTIAYSLGVPLPTLQLYFKVAKLPFMTRERILAGEVTLTTARRMIRLGAAQLAMLEEAAVSDQPLDTAFVKNLLQQRVTAGMQQVPLIWAEMVPPAPRVPAATTATIAEAAQELLRSLDVFLPQLQGEALGNLAQVRVSGRIFAQQLTALVRVATATQEGDAA